MVKQRHTPIRTCVACRETDEKRGLLRIVRQPDGTLCYDPKGKLSGRGAYVCARITCIALARKQKKLERSLKVSSVPENVFVELNAQAALNPSPESVSSTTVSPPVIVLSENGPGEQNRGANHYVATKDNEAATTPQESEAENA